MNEVGFDRPGSRLFISTGKGTVAVHDFPTLVHRQTLQAHTSNCYCIDFDQRGRYEDVQGSGTKGLAN